MCISRAFMHLPTFLSRGFRGSLPRSLVFIADGREIECDRHGITRGMTLRTKLPRQTSAALLT